MFDIIKLALRVRHTSSVNASSPLGVSKYAQIIFLSYSPRNPYSHK